MWQEKNAEKKWFLEKNGFFSPKIERLNSQQKSSDSVLHEARILFRQFATAQCPAKKAGAAGLPNSSQAILLLILSQTRAKGLKGKTRVVYFM